MQIAILAALFVATGAPAARGTPRFDQKAEVYLFANKPAKRTLVNVDLRISDPGAPQDKPKDARKIKVQLPPGLTYNPSVVPVCSIAEATQTGCPEETLVGGGILMYNFSPYLDPSDLFVHARFTIYRWQGDPIEQGRLLFLPQWDPGVLMSVPLYNRGEIAWFGTMTRRGQLTLEMPDVSALPSPLLRMNFGLGGRLPKGKPSPLRTPRRCNPDKGWKSRVTVTYDNNSREKDSTKHRCRRPS